MSYLPKYLSILFYVHTCMHTNSKYGAIIFYNVTSTDLYWYMSWHMNSCMAYTWMHLHFLHTEIYMQQICYWICTCQVIMTYSCSYITSCNKHRFGTIIISLVDICSWFRQILYYIQVALHFIMIISCYISKTRLIKSLND